MTTFSNATCYHLMRRFDFVTMRAYIACRKRNLGAKDSLDVARHLYRDRVAAKNAAMFA